MCRNPRGMFRHTSSYCCQQRYCPCTLPYTCYQNHQQMCYWLLDRSGHIDWSMSQHNKTDWYRLSHTSLSWDQQNNWFLDRLPHTSSGSDHQMLEDLLDIRLPTLSNTHPRICLSGSLWCLCSNFYRSYSRSSLLGRQGCTQSCGPNSHRNRWVSSCQLSDQHSMDYSHFCTVCWWLCNSQLDRPTHKCYWLCRHRYCGLMLDSSEHMTMWKDRQMSHLDT